MRKSSNQSPRKEARPHQQKVSKKYPKSQKEVGLSAEMQRDHAERKVAVMERDSKLKELELQLKMKALEKEQERYDRQQEQEQQEKKTNKIIAIVFISIFVILAGTHLIRSYTFHQNFETQLHDLKKDFHKDFGDFSKF